MSGSGLKEFNEEPRSLPRSVIESESSEMCDRDDSVDIVGVFSSPSKEAKLSVPNVLEGVTGRSEGFLEAEVTTKVVNLLPGSFSFSFPLASAGAGLL